MHPSLVLLYCAVPFNQGYLSHFINLVSDFLPSSYGIFKQPIIFRKRKQCFFINLSRQNMQQNDHCPRSANDAYANQDFFFVFLKQIEHILSLIFAFEKCYYGSSNNNTTSKEIGAPCLRSRFPM